MSDNTQDNPAVPASDAPEAKAAKRRSWPKKGADASKGKGTGQRKDHAPRDLYAEATNKIIAAMKKGTAPWQRPWDYKNILSPQNGASGHQYTGINPILLMIAAYEAQEKANQDLAEGKTTEPFRNDPRWATYDQAKDKGWNVKPGEKATTIYFFKPMEVEVKDDQGKPVVDTETGEIKMKTIPMLKSYGVFNMSQMENPPPALEATKGHDWGQVLAAENVIKSMGVPIMEGTDRAYYSPKLDTVTMPPRDSFKTPNDYYSVALHELGHATGAKHRLARDQSGKFSTPEYSYEELVAELTSMYTSLDVGIFSDANVERHASYLDSWIAALENDKKLIFKAAKEAERAADWVMDRDRTPAAEQKQKPKVEKVITPAVELGSTVKFVSEGKTIEGMVTDSRKGFGDTYQYQIKPVDGAEVKVWSSKGTMEVVAAPTEPFVKPEAPAKAPKEPGYTIYQASTLAGVEQAVSRAGYEVKQAVDDKWYYQEKGSAPSENAVLMVGKYAAASNAFYECAKDKAIDVPKTAVGIRVGKANLARFENPGELDTFVKENPDKLPAKTVEEVMTKFNEIHDMSRQAEAVQLDQKLAGNVMSYSIAGNSHGELELAKPDGSRVVIDDFDHLEVLLNMADLEDPNLAGQKDGIEQAYWQQLPAETYEAVSERLFQDRYGVGLGDITDLDRVRAEQSCGNHPAAMVEVLAVKYALTPKAEVAHPYGLSALQPGLHFNPTQGVATPAVLVPEQHFSNAQPGSGLGM